jgi:hypothetical protein
MRQSLYLLIALVAGLVIGQFSVKPDLRRAREEIASLRQQAQSRDRRGSPLRNVTQMLQMPEPAAPPPSPAPPPSSPAPSEPAAPALRAPTHFTNEILAAAELWQTRAALARATLMDRLNASPVQAQLFDQAITNMNAQLAEKIRAWTDHLKQQPEVTAEVALRMMNDLSGPVLATYEQLDEIFSGDWRAAAGRQFQLFDFINPAVALPLAEVEAAWSAPRPRRGR